MDQYLPPLVAITTGAVVVGLCFVLRIPFFLVGLLSIAMVFYAFQDHLFRFSYQYMNPTVPNVFKQHAPIFMITVVIALSIGFLLFRFGPKAITTNEQVPVSRPTPQGSQGIFDRFGRIFGTHGPYNQHPQHYNRRRYNNNDDYARSSTYDRV